MDQEPRNSGHDLLREFLSHRDAMCPACGYNLRGLTGQACPECAAALTLDVARAREGPWPVRVAFAGMIAFTAASVVDAAADVWYWFSPRQHWTIAVSFVGSIAGSVLGTAALVHCRIQGRRGNAARAALRWMGWGILVWAIWVLAVQVAWLIIF